MAYKMYCFKCDCFYFSAKSKSQWDFCDVCGEEFDEEIYPSEEEVDIDKLKKERRKQNAK